MAEYKVLIGFDYEDADGEAARAEPDDVIDFEPAEWLVEQDVVALVGEDAPADDVPVPDSAPDPAPDSSLDAPAVATFSRDFSAPVQTETVGV